MKKLIVMFLGAIMCSLFMSSCGNGYDAKCEELANAIDANQTGTATNILAELLSNIDKLNTEQAATACLATFTIIQSGDIAGFEAVYESMCCKFYEQAAKNPDEMKVYDADGTLTSVYETVKTGGCSSTDNYQGEDDDYEVREVAPAE